MYQSVQNSGLDTYDAEVVRQMCMEDTIGTHPCNCDAKLA
jgi:hypothetical protein